MASILWKLSSTYTFSNFDPRDQNFLNESSMFLVIFIKTKPDCRYGWLSGEQIPLHSHTEEEGLYQYSVFYVRPCSHLFFYYIVTFHHSVMVGNTGVLSPFASGLVSKLTAARRLSVPPLEYRSGSQTWVCLRITWSTYNNNIDCWILLSEVLTLEIGVGQENLVF